MMTSMAWFARLLAVGLLLAACAPSATPAPAPAPAAPTTAPAPSVAASAPAPTSPAAAPAAAGPLSPPATVRMGVLGITAEAGVYIALERGNFTEQGIVPDFTTLDTGARAIPALATGQLDVTGGGFSPAYVNAALRGVGMKMVAGISRNEPDGNSGFTVVREDLIDNGTVRDWADLKGFTVAVPGRGSVNDYSLARGLERGGL